MTTGRVRVGCLLVGAWLSALGCSSPDSSGSRGGAGGSGRSVPLSPGSSLNNADNANHALVGSGGSLSASEPAPSGCGDGTRTDDEACDDGNRKDGDGCSANCLSIEPGFSCPPGKPCHAIAHCGDGI
ncbi:MAG TPA: hypothetical protein VGI70_14930, partial [Polyangiales bacterium]